ncbi:Bifunctional serine/threonine-protein kinase/NEDD4-like E3 ubiquitin-protein ligase [Diplonema papillatum]|nr:Bifunctional serine/threonine-protein kinase/NEDD4-like E3 ubiquitin-protein ligase [Diplonema papillatum]
MCWLAELELYLDGGRGAKVETAAQLEAYVEGVCRWKLVGCRWEGLMALRAGYCWEAFDDASAVALLSWRDARFLLGGEPTLSAEAVLASMHFRSWKEADATPRHLCAVLRQLPVSGLRAFLRLCTGLSSLPHGGLAKRISVFKSSRFYAHTCFHQLSLPSFASAAKLRNALETVLASIAVSPALADLDDV